MNIEWTVALEINKMEAGQEFQTQHEGHILTYKILEKDGIGNFKFARIQGSQITNADEVLGEWFGVPANKEHKVFLHQTAEMRQS